MIPQKLMRRDDTKPPRVYTTAEAAAITRHQPTTYREELCRKGHFQGVVPIKLPSGGLRWPAAAIEALVAFPAD